MLQRLVTAVVALGVLLAACSSDDATATTSPSDAGASSNPDGNANADTGSPSDAGGGADADAAFDASSDAGQCAVKNQCTNPSTTSVPPEISGELDPSCAAGQDGGALEERCTAFCKANNSGFAGQTTCVVASGGTTFHCRCVNP